MDERESEPDLEEKGEEELLGSSLVQELDDIEQPPAQTQSEPAQVEEPKKKDEPGVTPEF